MNDLVLELECSEPLYHQLFAALRDRVLAGEIRPGTRLPATRALAERLGVSRSVVVAGYKLLIEEGYAYAHVGSGTFVKSQHHDAEPPQTMEPGQRDESLQAEPRVSRLVRRLLEIDFDSDARAGTHHEDESIDFGLPTGWPPRNTEKRTWGETADAQQSKPHGAGEPPFGLPALRDALAKLLQRSRDIRCAAEQIAIVPDSQYAYELLARTLADAGSSVLIEDPNHPHVRTTFDAVGAALQPCSIGETGLSLDAAPQGGSAPGLICVAPTDQFPSGTTMDLASRRRLLARSSAIDAMVIEDSLDANLGPAPPNAPWLGSLDREGRVIHLATAAHVPTPDLRLSFVVLPETLIEPVQHLLRFSPRPAPADVQDALARLIANGMYERLARRAQRRQARLRATLIEELRRCFGDEVRISGGVAAPRTTLRFPDLSVDDEARLARYARDQHVAVTRLSTFYVAAPPRAGIVLGFGELSEPEVREGIRRLHHVWRGPHRVGASVDH
jgi:GntR family transcriptional regulator/MocR family aminotransferase